MANGRDYKWTQPEAADEPRDERSRAAAINDLAQKHGMQADAEKAIRDGISFSAFRSFVWREAPAKRSQDPFHPNDYRGYSLVDHIQSKATGVNASSLVQEMSDHLQKEWRVDLRHENAVVVAPGWFKMGRRDLEIGGTASGAPLRATDLADDEFIASLRPFTAVMASGARSVGPFHGNVDIPRQLTTAAPTWLAEGDPVVSNNLTLDLLSLSPKTVAFSSLSSRRPGLQATPSVEDLVRLDFLQGYGVELDRVAVSGNPASNEPRGILNTTGVNAVVFDATNGPTMRSSVVDLTTAVASDNVVGENEGIITTAGVRRALREDALNAANPDKFVWDGSPRVTGGDLIGFPARLSSTLPTTLGPEATSIRSSSGCGAISSSPTGARRSSWSTRTRPAQGRRSSGWFHDLDVVVRHPRVVRRDRWPLQRWISSTRVDGGGPGRKPCSRTRRLAFRSPSACVNPSRCARANDGGAERWGSHFSRTRPLGVSPSIVRPRRPGLTRRSSDGPR
ncbi:MAG: phage major capsid protein [Myxococcota bacterium]